MHERREVIGEKFSKQQGGKAVRPRGDCPGLGKGSTSSKTGVGELTPFPGRKGRDAPTQSLGFLGKPGSSARVKRLWEAGILRKL